MKRMNWNRGARLLASAFFAAAAAGACRGNHADKTDYDMNPPAATGADTAPTASTLSPGTDTMKPSKDSLIPVPGTPHHIRPGVTDTPARSSTPSTTRRSGTRTRTSRSTTGATRRDTSAGSAFGGRTDSSTYTPGTPNDRTSVTDSGAMSPGNPSTVNPSATQNPGTTGDLNGSGQPTPANNNPSATTQPSTTQSDTAKTPNASTYQGSSSAQVVDTVRGADSVHRDTTLTPVTPSNPR